MSGKIREIRLLSGVDQDAPAEALLAAVGEPGESRDLGPIARAVNLKPVTVSLVEVEVDDGAPLGQRLVAEVGDQGYFDLNPISIDGSTGGDGSLVASIVSPNYFDRGEVEALCSAAEAAGLEARVGSTSEKNIGQRMNAAEAFAGRPGVVALVEWEFS